MNQSVTIIAEVKTHSPFGWKSEKSWDELFDVADSVGDLLSVHTDPRWNGSFDLIKKARALTTKPILAKGIHAHDSDIENALIAGADFVLVVGRIPNVHKDKCIIEPYTLEDLQSLPGGVRAVWNSRDLETGGMKQEDFKIARGHFPGWLCQASNIKTIDDVDDAADAVLVGTNLEQFATSLH